MTNPQPFDDDVYVSTDAREMAAYAAAMQQTHPEELEGYEEDMEILRGVM